MSAAFGRERGIGARPPRPHASAQSRGSQGLCASGFLSPLSASGWHDCWNAVQGARRVRASRLSWLANKRSWVQPSQTLSKFRLPACLDVGIPTHGRVRHRHAPHRKNYSYADLLLTFSDKVSLHVLTFRTALLCWPDLLSIPQCVYGFQSGIPLSKSFSIARKLRSKGLFCPKKGPFNGYECSAIDYMYQNSYI